MRTPKKKTRPGRENQFPNPVARCQRGALLYETVPCDDTTSGFVSDLFTDTLSKKHFDEKHFFFNLQVYKMLHF